MRQVLKVAYAPMMLLGFNGVAVWIVALDATRFWLLPLLLAAITTSFTVERIIPYEPAWNRDRGDTGVSGVFACALRFQWCRLREHNRLRWFGP